MHLLPIGVRSRSKNRKFRTFLGLSLKLAILIIIFGLGVAWGRGAIGFKRRPLKAVSQNLPADLNYQSVEELYDFLKTDYDGQLDENKLLDGLKTGLVEAAGDPYTEYLNPESAKAFDEQLSGSFEGIGAELSKENGAIVIVSPIAGFPADKAGLKSKDIITEIDGQSAHDLTVSEAVKRIRGTKGTTVKLKVVRNGSEELTFDITRGQINIPSVNSEILPGDIGYLKIIRFGEDTSQLAAEAALKFRSSNVKGVIVDVRGDPGGLLDASFDVASLWLNNKTVLEERRGGVVTKTHKSSSNAVLEGVPTVILINSGSASASEILAGALRDNHAATAIGVKSYGKGSVQQLEQLSNQGRLKVTIARWYTPAGKNIDKEGITPDQIIELSEDDAKNKRDPQKDAAIQYLTSQTFPTTN